MNTKITYLYRDADNYKAYNECVVDGEITDWQIAEILSCLSEDVYFIPSKVGMPERRFETYDPEVDHPWFELVEYSFELTGAEPTIYCSLDKLVDRFKQAKNNWDGNGEV